MKMFFKGKDGGPKSTVTGYWLIEIKSLFSIVLLRFDKGTRENFHNHAFNAITWFLKGRMLETVLDSETNEYIEDKPYTKSIIPKYTARKHMHKVYAFEKSWALSIRGPWSKTWQEYDPFDNKVITLTSGRKIIKEDYKNE